MYFHDVPQNRIRFDGNYLSLCGGGFLPFEFLRARPELRLLPVQPVFFLLLRRVTRKRSGTAVRPEAREDVQGGGRRGMTSF